MAAPPLPPKCSSSSWMKDCIIDAHASNSSTFLGSGSSTLPLLHSSVFDHISPVDNSKSQVENEAPPIPPRPTSARNWDQRYTDQLSAVPPPPRTGHIFKTQQTFSLSLPPKNLNSHLSRDVKYNTFIGNCTTSFNSQAYRPDSHNASGVSANNIFVPCFTPRNPSRFVRFLNTSMAFGNTIYHTSSVMPSISNGFDIHHSKSAPDLVHYTPNILPVVHRSSVPDSSTTSNVSNIISAQRTHISSVHNVDVNSQVNLEGLLKFMKKKRDSNLIDLYCSENEPPDISHLGNKKSHIDDIIKLFDPLAETAEEFVLSSADDNELSNEMSLKNTPDFFSGQTSVASSSNETKLQSESNSNKSETVYATIPFAVSPSEILKVSRRSITCNVELQNFCKKLQKLRSEFSYDDCPTNTGVVISPTLDNYHEDSLSIQLIIHSSYSEKPVSFTCDVNTSIEHIISHTVCSLLDDASSLSMDNFILKIYGLSEYFSAHSVLADYEYVHQCHKFDKPVLLTLIDIKDLRRSLARTNFDDINDGDFKVSDITSLQRRETINYETLNILIETLDKEIEKIKSCALKLKSGDGLCPQGVIQAVKAICTLLSHVEISEITDAVNSLIEVCLLFRNPDTSDFDTLPELGVVPEVSENKLLDQLFPLLELSLQKLQQAVHLLLLIYTKTFNVDFEVKCTKDYFSTKSVTDFLDTLLLQVSVLHGLPHNTWSQFSNYNITCEVCYGKTMLASISTKTVSISKSFFPRLLFDNWLQFESVSMCTLPRETVLYFTVWGFDITQSEGNPPAKTPVGWCGVRLFNYEDEMLQGGLLLGIWPQTISQNCGPLLSNPSKTAPLLQVSLPEFDCIIKFPHVVDNKFATFQKRSFEDLNPEVQASIMEIIERDVLSPLKSEEKELLWEKRNYLHKFPQALPKILLSAHGWDWACLSDIYSLLKDWHPLSPVDSLTLILPCFPDRSVRDAAVCWMKNMVSDELYDYLPQMVQVLRYEAWDDSSVAWFLLERSLTNIRIAHHMYWLLKQNINDPIAGRRMQLMQNSLLTIVGQAMRKSVAHQETLLNNLSDLAEKIKTTKESLRLSILFHELEITHHNLCDNLTCLPLSPSLEVCGVDVKSCSYFTSNTLPIKISFYTPENGAKNREAIYKVGDDLRQDMITLQMIRIMDKLWLKDGLDLKIVTFMCVATEYKKGMVELVPESETLRKIQTELGLTGSFKDRSITEWLQKYNTSELEYQQAVENFTLSCAGYCVATYILGICDRHNDNIMLKTSGHIFHIDFGKFLGDAQMFGNIKRDRTPFVLTSDMAYVINGGDKPSKRFQYFIDLCCQAFNIIRKHSGIFFNLFSLMVSSGVPGLSENAVMYVRKALMPDLSEAEATAQFTRMIQESLKSWFTQFNFFIHNLAQLRFTGDHNDDLLLSFIPKVYSKESDGKINSAAVIGYKKIYDPEKYYIYIVNVERQNLPVSSCVFRTYREFIEFHQKMCMMFPLAKFHPLPGNPLVGRTNVRNVTDRRKEELKLFLDSLFKMAEEIAHCELVYTFFHPMLRDQEGMAEAKEAKAALKRSRRNSSISELYGQIKLSIVYKNNSLFIMVMHAKNLNSPKGTAPDPYVKTYLIPDPNKLTKRKTKIIFRNCHPTFMEMLVYVLPVDVVSHRTLYVSVWDYDRVQENEFMGAALIPLSECNLSVEKIQWYQLRGINH